MVEKKFSTATRKISNYVESEKSAWCYLIYMRIVIADFWKDISCTSIEQWL